MANSNVPQDKRKAKLKRRRREIDRMIDRMAASDTPDADRKARDLRKTMRYDR